nr:MAG TPA: hypothetical protein [Caudoviricetes sp.]
MRGWRACWRALAGRPDLEHTLTLLRMPSDGLRRPQTGQGVS